MSRGPENAALAKKSGADLYCDKAATDAAAELQKLGGARVIVAAAPGVKSSRALVGGPGAMLIRGLSSKIRGRVGDQGGIIPISKRRAPAGALRFPLS
jgi:hypothetical protein